MAEKERKDKGEMQIAFVKCLLNYSNKKQSEMEELRITIRPEEGEGWVLTEDLPRMSNNILTAESWAKHSDRYSDLPFIEKRTKKVNNPLNCDFSELRYNSKLKCVESIGKSKKCKKAGYRIKQTMETWKIVFLFCYDRDKQFPGLLEEFLNSDYSNKTGMHNFANIDFFESLKQEVAEGKDPISFLKERTPLKMTELEKTKLISATILFKINLIKLLPDIFREYILNPNKLKEKVSNIKKGFQGTNNFTPSDVLLCFLNAAIIRNPEILQDKTFLDFYMDVKNKEGIFRKNISLLDLQTSYFSIDIQKMIEFGEKEFFKMTDSDNLNIGGLNERIINDRIDEKVIGRNKPEGGFSKEEIWEIGIDQLLDPKNQNNIQRLLDLQQKFEQKNKEVKG